MGTGAQRHKEIEHTLASGYAPRPGVFDEFVDAAGVVRPHWRPLVEALSVLSPSGLAQRAERINKRVRDIGIANDAFSDPNEADQPWHLDLMPLIFDAATWRELAAGVEQRARLYQAILADIYGPQKLIERGLVPHELVFADRTFLPPCHGIVPPGGHLQFYACDVARGADGRWRVIDSHAETMAGIGFALANRMTHTHVLGGVFRAAGATRLAGYFQSMQDALTTQCGRPDPRMALLTPGPHHSDYFSHAYIARYLGHLLVEGGDMRSVGDHVFLKTLEGLKPIDLIVRCVEGAFADPLELDPRGGLGCVGLVEAVRKTPNLVVNALGTAIVENRGFGGYLARLSEELLGEPLALWEAPRWWLGDAKARDLVLAEPGRFVIRAAQEGTGRPGRAELGRKLADGEASAFANLKGTIEMFGARLVAEEPVGFATTPALAGHGAGYAANGHAAGVNGAGVNGAGVNGAGAGLVAEPYAVRLFACATPGGFIVMPGGLAMTVDDQRAVALSAARAQTRDVWVLGEGGETPFKSLWRPAIETAAIERSQRALQSRVADNLFWLGRYAERADWLMRVLRSSLNRLEEEAAAANNGLQSARRSLARILARDAKAATIDPAATDAAAVLAMAGLLLDGTSGYGLPGTLDALHRTASQTRDRLSLEVWRTLNTLRGEALRFEFNPTAGVGDVLDRIDEGLAGIAAFNGLMHENMTRNFGWSFIDMGRRLERGFSLCEAIDAMFTNRIEPAQETPALIYLLEVGDSFITYRSRYRLDPMLHLVLDLLLLDETNPRSLAYQLAALSRHLESLPQAKQGTVLPEERRLALALRTAIQLSEVADLSKVADRRQLGSLMHYQLETLPSLSDAITRRYFSLTDDAPKRVIMRTEPSP
ncbi:MAG: circularly permuted type 2 ATP-grasp protein [Hyphomicrobiaceae bacterium]|nr:circularly permuted type 2 ATP-grasp protein [Hyphomicrobiaceae bacterium]